MMAWLILLLLIGMALLLLWRMGVGGGLLTGSAAALTLGAAGYALQGDPAVPSAPAIGRDSQEVLPLTDARHAFYGDFSAAESWMRMSEALARRAIARMRSAYW